MKVKLAGIGKTLLIPVFAIALAGGSAAVVGATSGTNSTDDTVAVVTSDSPSPEASESETPDAKEDSVERFHGDGTTACDAPEGTTLEGNWTHGDFVSAWAHAGDHDKTLAAAQSRCGKPMSAHVKDASDENAGSQASEHRKDKSEVHGKSAEHNSHADEADDDEAEVEDGAHDDGAHDQAEVDEVDDHGADE